MRWITLGLVILATGFAGIQQSIAEEQSSPEADSIKVTLLVD